MRSYSKRNASFHRRNREHQTASQRCPLIDDDSSFQRTFRIPEIRTHSTVIPSPTGESECSLPAPPPAWVSSHHWHRHRHRASNERLAMKQVEDWLNHINHDDAVPPPSEFDRHHDILVVHEHRCRRYYLHRQY